MHPLVIISRCAQGASVGSISIIEAPGPLGQIINAGDLILRVGTNNINEPGAKSRGRVCCPSIRGTLIRFREIVI